MTESFLPEPPVPPKGYAWRQLPADVFGLGISLPMCELCGVLVADTAVHNEWHAA